MPRFSANLGFLWQERTLPERIFAARDAGFTAVECHFPYDTDPKVISSALSETGLKMLALNTYPGAVEQGEFGLCALPEKQERARQAIDQAVSYAAEIGARRIHIMAGLSGDSNEATRCFMENLIYASDQAAQHRLGLLIEPINRTDKPNYMLHRTQQAVDIIENLRTENAIDNIGLMFDCYHVQKTEGDIFSRLTAAMPYIAHIQIAAVPGRGEPDSGEVNYQWLFKQIDEMNYQGYIGAEYVPVNSTDEGLDWLSPYL